jgi:hypothetical protein
MHAVKSSLSQPRFIRETVSIGGRRSVNSFVTLSPIPYTADIDALAKRGTSLRGVCKFCSLRRARRSIMMRDLQ